MQSGTGSGYDDTHILSGHAEYSAADCGGNICPFYLAAFEASNTVDNWNIWLEITPVVDEPKIVSDLSIEALTSTYAVWRPATGQVAFFPGTLTFQVAFVVDSTCSTCTGFADDSWSFSTVANDDVVYGDYDPTDNSLEITYDFPLPGGNATLSADFVVADGPPTAAIDLPAEPSCNHANGYELTEIDVASTDPDNDIEGHLWIVDGIPYSHGHVMSLGSHVVELLAFDSRGARSYAGPQTHVVVRGTPCL